MSDYTIKDKAAVVGVGETIYYKRGGAPVPEFRLACEAVMKAADDAGLKVSDIDGFCSYSNDRNEGARLAAALGLRELRFSNMVWGGGGGGMCGAVANAAMSVACGYANHVVVFRALAQGQFGRFGGGVRAPELSGPFAYGAAYGLMSPAQMFAMRVRRFMHEHRITQDAQAAVVLASYHHAQSNPRAVMYGRPLTREAYDNSRWIVEPFHLYDCCLENDGAAALILTTPERARDLRQKAVYLMAATQTAPYRGSAPVHNDADYASSNFKTSAPRLFQTAGIGPHDVDVLQSYENFSGGVMMAIVEHGFCDPDEVMNFFKVENFLAPGGKLPLNTSGGNLAECYMHGLELAIEGVRQARGQSTSQVPGAEISMVVAGPMVTPCTAVIFHN